VDVVGVEDDARLNAGRVARSRRHERDARRSVRRVELDPPVAVAPGDVVPLLESEHLVERHRPILVGRRDGHELDPAEPAGCGGRHLVPLSVTDSAATTPRGGPTHRQEPLEVVPLFRTDTGASSGWLCGAVVGPEAAPALL